MDVNGSRMKLIIFRWKRKPDFQTQLLYWCDSKCSNREICAIWNFRLLECNPHVDRVKGYQSDSSTRKRNYLWLRETEIQNQSFIRKSKRQRVNVVTLKFSCLLYNFSYSSRCSTSSKDISRILSKEWEILDERVGCFLAILIQIWLDSNCWTCFVKWGKSWRDCFWWRSSLALLLAM